MSRPMASNPTYSVRLRPVVISYLDELADIGYARGRAGVMRRFIEDGVIRAIERRVLAKKNAKDFGEGAEAEDDED